MGEEKCEKNTFTRWHCPILLVLCAGQSAEEFSHVASFIPYKIFNQGIVKCIKLWPTWLNPRAELQVKENIPPMIREISKYSNPFLLYLADNEWNL